MNETWLVLDCSFLAYRNAFSLMGLEHEFVATSVLFGLMRDLRIWSEQFGTTKFVFCFDWGRNKRNEIYPEYKQNRKKDQLPPEEAEQRRKLREQLKRLAEEDLFALGFRNVFWEEGYEADDVIASVVLSSIPEGDRAVIVASDADLYQLISGRTSMYDPVRKKQKTLQWFSKKYGIDPGQWADVKALAGCPGDNVVGVRRIGEKSVVQYLKGELKGGRLKTLEAGAELWRFNLRLVRLPFEGCPVFELREDKLSRDRWRKTCEKYGMETMRGAYPGR